jgi:hypothetical protein
MTYIIAEPCIDIKDRGDRRAGRGCRTLARSPGAGREHDPDEVRHVGLLALTTIGFPHTVAGLGWIDEVIASKG